MKAIVLTDCPSHGKRKGIYAKAGQEVTITNTDHNNVYIVSNSVEKFSVNVKNLKIK